VAGGYFLGRTKKMKLALALAGMAAGRRAGGPGELLAQGTKLLGKSADLTKLTDEVRGRLLDAGKQAAVAVATRQVEALTDRVTQRVSGLTDVTSEVTPARRRGPAPEDGPADEVAAEDEEVEPDVEPEPSAEAEPDEEPPPPRRRASAGGGRARAGGAAATRAGGATGTARRASGTANSAASNSGRRAPRTRRRDDD
jgi:hypothetical protein